MSPLKHARRGVRDGHKPAGPAEGDKGSPERSRRGDGDSSAPARAAVANMSGREWLRETEQGVEIQVLVVPRASVSELAGVQEGRLKVRLAAPPVDGKANEELVRFLARTFAVPRSRIELSSGATGRRKEVRVSGTTRAHVLERLGKVAGERS